MQPYKNIRQVFTTREEFVFFVTLIKFIMKAYPSTICSMEELDDEHPINVVPLLLHPKR